MKCTGCNKGSLLPGYLDGQLKAHMCSHCKGSWILVEDFVEWKKHNPDHHFSGQAIFSGQAMLEQDLSDTKKALFCPMSGTLMRKFRISSTHEHKLDYSAAVGGIWLDCGEWELLKSEGLAESLNALVTQQWQNQIREQSAKQNFSDIYKEKLGEEPYTRVKEFRTWLDKQPNKADLRAYLFAEDPYSAEQ